MLKKIGTRLLCLSLLLLVAVMPFTAQKTFADEPDVLSHRVGQGDALSEMRLCPGGDVFGVRMFMPGVMVVGLCEVVQGDLHTKPAQEGGVALKDIITHINGQEVRHTKQVTDFIERSEGKPLSFTVNRKGETLTLSLTPVLSSENNRYRLGILVRDRTAGIGTVTFIDPKTGAFGGLGHGICDPDTGEVIPLSRGTVTDVHLLGIARGSSGTPGEIRGVLGHCKRGVLTVNSHAGVFGILTDLSSDLQKEALPLARAAEVKVGKAEILCTLADGKKDRYTIEITKIHEKNKDAKCFSIRVTDPALLEITGGIVQGMSGSPIIQNGKLIGAVTHVTVADPTCGYGIFIENMLANMPAEMK